MIRTLATPVNARVGPVTHRHVRSKQLHRKTHEGVITERPGLLRAPRHSPNAHHNVTLMAKGRGAYCRGNCHGPLRWQASRRQANDRPRGIGSAALSLIGGGLTLCVLGAAVYDIGRAFSVW